MHEYILFSQIPAARESQVLNILAGVTGTQPVPIAEQTLIYGQTKAQEQVVSKKTKQQQPQKQIGPNYHKLQRDIDIKDENTVEAGPWKFRAEQTPAPGIAAYISREVSERPAGQGELDALRKPGQYRYKQQYTIIGNRYVHGNVVVRIMRYWIPEETSTTDLLDSPPHPPAKLRLLDPSGTLVIESVVRVGDAANSKLTDQAKQELQAFQATLEGAVDLYAPDRLALDTRVKNV